MEKEGLAVQWSQLVKSSEKENLWNAKQDYSIGFPDCALYSSLVSPPPFKSCFIQSPWIKLNKIRTFPTFLGIVVVFPSHCCLSAFKSQNRGKIPGKVKMDPLTWPSVLPQILCQRPCCSPSALSPFSFSPTHSDSQLPWNILVFRRVLPPALLSLGKHACFWSDVSFSSASKLDL